MVDVTSHSRPSRVTVAAKAGGLGAIASPRHRVAAIDPLTASLARPYRAGGHGADPGAGRRQAHNLAALLHRIDGDHTTLPQTASDSVDALLVASPVEFRRSWRHAVSQAAEIVTFAASPTLSHSHREVLMADLLLALEQECSVRKICAVAVTGVTATEDMLTRLEARKAQIRVTKRLPADMAVVDGRTAFLFDGSNGNYQGGLVVRAHSVVSSLTALFEVAWREARCRSVVQPQEEERRLGRAVIASLAAGLKDDAAARKLGISVRTYRRYVSDIMRSLDCDSRFQAGVKASRLGWS